MHKLQELFHDFANRISAMNSPIAMLALSYLNKDLNSLTTEEKNNLLDKLGQALEKSHSAYSEIIDADDKIIEALPPAAANSIIGYFEDIMDIVHKASRRNNTLSVKLSDYTQDCNFQSYMKPILEQALEFDKQMIPIAEQLEKAKDVLRKQGLYPKKGEQDA